MGSSQPDAGGHRELTTWKEVAAFLGVSVRTAQYWEETMALPVRRLTGAKGRVMANPEELAAWKLSRTQPPHSKPGAGDEGPANGRGAWQRKIAAITLIPAAALAAWWASHLLRQDLGNGPASANLAGNELVALDAAGREVWRKSFHPFLASAHYSSAAVFRDYVWCGDLNGDGGNEVLFAAIQEPSQESTGELICYDRRGNESWRFRPRMNLRTAARTVQNRWIPYSVAVGRGSSGQKSIYATFNNVLSSPSVVARLSASGGLESYYLHSGHLHILKFWKNSPNHGEALLAGGINNRMGRATLVLLDPERLAGVSAEPGSPAEQLLGGYPDSSLSRAFFARTALGRVLEAYNSVYHVRVLEHGIQVEIDEAAGNPEGALVLYELDTGFRVRSVRFHDRFQVVHAQSLARGLIKSPFSEMEAAELQRAYLLEGRQPLPAR